MRNAQCSGTRTFRIREDMQLCHRQTLQECIALLEVFILLSTCSHHHIHTDERIRHHLLDHIDLMRKQGRVVTTVHQLQYRIRSALKRDMEMWHKGTTLCTIRYQVIFQQIGFQTADAVAGHTLHLIQRLYKIEETLTRRSTEITNIHTCKHNFLTTLTHSLFRLLNKRGNRRISTESTGIGNRAIGTEIAATILYFQEISRAVSPGTTGGKRLYILCLLLPEHLCFSCSF